MNAHLHEIKFTDDMEREMIQQEIDDRNQSIGNTADPLLNWIGALALSAATLFFVLLTGR